MIDISTLTPSTGEGMPGRRSTRTTGPNPFLDGFPDGNGGYNTTGTLLDSYGTGQDYSVTVKGEYEDTVIRKGARAGEPTQRLIGDAATVVSMLRTASNKLGIGVAIVVTPAKRKGTMTVQYVGKERKNYGRQDEDSEE